MKAFFYLTKNNCFFAVNTKGSEVWYSLKDYTTPKLVDKPNTENLALVVSVRIKSELQSCLTSPKLFFSKLTPETVKLDTNTAVQETAHFWVGEKHTALRFAEKLNEIGLFHKFNIHGRGNPNFFSVTTNSHMIKIMESSGCLYCENPCKSVDVSQSRIYLVKSEKGTYKPDKKQIIYEGETAGVNIHLVVYKKDRTPVNDISDGIKNNLWYFKLTKTDFGHTEGSKELYLNNCKYKGQNVCREGQSVTHHINILGMEAGIPAIIKNEVLFTTPEHHHYLLRFQKTWKSVLNVKYIGYENDFAALSRRDTILDNCIASGKGRILLDDNLHIVKDYVHDLEYYFVS